MRILFFDNWLKGVKNFTRLLPELSKYSDVEVTMLHTGSWKESDIPKVTTIEGLKCVDISYYGTWSLYKAIKSERPDVVVTLNMYNFTDRALVAICRKLGIRIIYLSHGRFSLADASDLTALVEKRRSQKSLAERFNRENRMMFGNYAFSTLLTGRPWRFPVAMWHYMTDAAYRSVNTPYTPELAPDKILLYYDSDRRIMSENRHFPPHNIQVVGNPELDDFITAPLLERNVFCKRYNVPEGPYLLYLDDGLAQNKLMSIEHWKEHVRETARLARKKGLNLIIKLHPRVDVAPLTAFFSEEGITTYGRDVDFKNLIWHSAATTSIFSSTIAFALILGKRVISPRWQSTADFPKSYPADVIRYAYTPDEYAEALTDDTPTCTDTSYIANNFGDVTSAAIPKIIEQILF